MAEVVSDRMEPEDDYLEIAVNINFVNKAESEETDDNFLWSSVDNVNVAHSLCNTKTSVKFSAVESF